MRPNKHSVINRRSKKELLNLITAMEDAIVKLNYGEVALLRYTFTERQDKILDIKDKLYRVYRELAQVCREEFVK